MKKSLLALAVLGAFAGAASAQSSVTLFGVVDIGVKHATGTGKSSLNTEGTDGNASNRLGVRGVEDLGGGLNASFWLEHGFTPDTGAVADTTRFWNRRATASLGGGFGELRLGRDYTSTFSNYAAFDPFGANGVANFLNVNTRRGTTGVRADNMIGYFLPGNLGGFFGNVQASAGEGVDPTNKSYSGRLGYAAGPLNVGAAYRQQNAAAPKLKDFNVGASYDFGAAKVSLAYDQTKDFIAAGNKQTQLLAGLWVPVGAGTIKFAYNRMNGNGALPDANLIGVGYVHDLSKRTALYAHYARLSNKNGGSLGLGVTPNVNGTASALELGVRHSF